MQLNTLAREYRGSGKKCNERASELDRTLRQKIKVGETSATATARERRRIAILRTMARECFATASYLENYYQRGISFEKYI